MNRLSRKVFHWLLACILCYSACKYETIEDSGSVSRALDWAKEDLLVRDSLPSESMRGSRGDGNRVRTHHHPPKNHKNIGFLSKTCPDHL